MFQALLQGFRKAFFFLLQGIGHECADPLHGVGCFSHDADQGINQLVEERLGQAQLGPVPQRPADDPAQHVAPALVGRDNAIGHQKSAGADMVGYHPPGNKIVDSTTCEGLYRLDQGTEQVCVVIVAHTLQQRRGPLQAHAGIH